MSNQETRPGTSSNPYNESTNHGTTSPTFVVGIVLLRAVGVARKLFQNLPADTGMAFVVIQHLSPDFKSMMYELLARDTSMQIHRVEDGMLITKPTTST